jgi:predicted Zn finger-like uncharacterized protein
MPMSITCPSCQTRLKVGDNLLGKRVKCPRCQQGVPVLAANPARVPAAQTAAVPAESPPAAARQEDEWIDVNEAASPQEVAAAAAVKGTPPTGDWGQDLMEEHDVPEEIQEEIHAALSKNERLTWFGRPRMDILLARARNHQIRMVLVGFGLAIALPFLAVFLFTLKGAPAGAIIGGIIVLLFAAGAAALGVYAIGLTARVRRGAGTRPCYAITNRRLLIHPGKGKQINFSRDGSSSSSVNAGSLSISSYSGLGLTRINRMELRRFPGCGELVFNRTLLDEPAGGAMWAVEGVREVEKLIRKQLVHPIIDKLLRGESLTSQEKGSAAKEEAEQGERLEAPDENIKDFVRGGGAAAADANVKDAGGKLRQDKVDPELRQQVEEELAEDEQVVWVGEPEGRTKGRGMLGGLTGAAERREPDYYLYAITNRRVLLFCEKGTRVGKGRGISFTKGEKRGPMSYYPPHLLNAGLEEDRRFPRGGGIILKKVKVVITTTTTTKGGRGMQSTRTSTRTEWHYFGLLRIRNYLSVAQLLYDTLIGPCRGG